MGGRVTAAAALFDEALELPADQRKAFLEVACRGDRELLDLVGQLLASHEEAPRERLEEPLFRPPDSVLAELDLGTFEDPPDIGPYELLSKIGEGGTSTVYLARRLSGPSPEVALKIPWGLPPKEAEARVRREQRAVAALDHPAITKQLDSGVSDGRAYLAMEYIDGLPAVAHCDVERKTIRERLHLFLSICDAVDHAHRHLIVHRDLKPNNILVDDSGAPHILDFGIAKLLDPPPSEETSLSLANMLTPGYAAPEQFTGGTVTTATDVYSLGVLLYELLTGRRPREWRGRAPAEIERIWEGSVPLAPSQQFGPWGLDGEAVESVEGLSPESESAELADRRGTSVEEIRRRLSGDLDHITLKALRFEPYGRYPSVVAFMDDVRRHLEGRTVLARPATWGYRVGRLVRRHRLVFGLASLLALSLVGLAVSSTVLAGRLVRERDLAREQVARAEAVTGFLVQSFEGADPLSGVSSDTTAKEIIDRSVALTAVELADEPELQAAVYQTLGEISLRQGEIERAGDLLERSTSLHRETAGEMNLALAAVISGQAAYFGQAGDLEAAETAAQEALQMRSKLAGEHSLEAGASLRQLASIAVERGELDVAEGMIHKAREIHAAFPGEEREVADDIKVNMKILFHRGDLEGSEAMGREALALSEASFPPGSSAVADSLGDLGAVIWARGRYREASHFFQRALEMHRLLLGADHPRVALDLGNLAAIHQQLGEFDRAIELQRTAYEMVLERLGPEHYKTANMAMNLASILQGTGRYEESDQLLRVALTTARESFGPDHPRLAKVMQAQATNRLLSGDPAAAEPLLAEALEINRRRLGDTAQPTCETTMLMARVQERLDRIKSARENYEAARSCFVGSIGARHYLVGLASLRLAEQELAAGLVPSALSQAREGLEIIQESLPGDHWRVAEGRSILGAIFLAAGRLEDAETELRFGYLRLVETMGVDALPTQDALRRLTAGGLEPVGAKGASGS